VSKFLVEVYVPRGASEPELKSDAAGVRLLRSIFVPTDETCFYLFEGQSDEAVREAAARSGLEVERVVEAVSDSGASR
jgi:hypothetical protein